MQLADKILALESPSLDVVAHCDGARCEQPPGKGLVQLSIRVLNDDLVFPPNSKYSVHPLGILHYNEQYTAMRDGFGAVVNNLRQLAENGLAFVCASL